MLDISASYSRYSFLGHEFLTWLWYIIEKDPDRIKDEEGVPIFLEIGNRIVLENMQKDAVESITIKGDDAGLEEGVLALRKGAVVTEINLILRAGDQEWQFTIKGEGLSMVSLKPPSSGSLESKKDLEGIVIEKVYLVDRIIRLMDDLYKQFIKLRVSMDWNEKVIPFVRQWIYS